MENQDINEKNFTGLKIEKARTIRIAGGQMHTIALRNDGTLWGWGVNIDGRVGDGTNKNRPTPVQIQLANVTAIACGQDHSLALTTDGSVYSWGYNANGQLGDGTTTSKSVPTKISGLSNIVSISAFGIYSAAISGVGQVFTWGMSNSGSTPTTVSGLTDVKAIAVGSGHFLALKSDGSVWSWGKNSFGQLGDDTRNDKAFPAPISNLSDIVSIACGGEYSLGVKRDGTLFSWGLNNAGQLGDGSKTFKTAPAMVPGNTNAVSVQAGSNHTLVLLSDGTIHSFGENSNGQLGNGDTVAQLNSITVSGLSGITSIGIGVWQSLAIRNDGAVFSWGGNSYYQLGDGTGNNRSTPAVVNFPEVFISTPTPTPTPQATSTTGTTTATDTTTGPTTTTDTIPPVISAVTSGSVTQTSAVITWTTDEDSTSQVEYGTTTAYGSTTTLDSTKTKSHSVSVTGLTAATTYHYRVKSKDAAGNDGVSIDNTFTTSPATVAGTTQVAIGGGQIMYFVEIPAGTFAMGSPSNEQFRQSNETQHQVTISKAFYMGKHEVTQAQYKQLMGTNPSYYTPSNSYSNTDNQPVEQVSWFDSVRFCNALSANQGLTPSYTNQSGNSTITDNDTVTCNWSANGYRLPTEAEWEYACRGGTTSMFYWANAYDEAQKKQYAWFYLNADGNYWTIPHADKGGTQPVGTKLPNAFGLYDMSGNVWEWCNDWYGTYDTIAQTDPRGASAGSARVHRGAGWVNFINDLRSAFRDWNNAPAYRGYDLGFRLVRPK